MRIKPTEKLSSNTFPFDYDMNHSRPEPDLLNISNKRQRFSFVFGPKVRFATDRNKADSIILLIGSKMAALNISYWFSKSLVNTAYNWLQSFHGVDS
jgi:hypothetical protein